MRTHCNDASQGAAFGFVTEAINLSRRLEITSKLKNVGSCEFPWRENTKAITMATALEPNAPLQSS